MKYIVTADLHLRADRPLCRLDPDWMLSQREMLQFIVKQANDNKADIVISGDVYDSYVVPVSVSTMFLQEMRRCMQQVHVLGGNHALKNHREEYADESSIGVLKYVDGNITYLQANEEKTDGRFEHSKEINNSVISIHTLTFRNEEDIPFEAKATCAQALLNKYNTYDALFLGDNHEVFVYQEGKDRIVINPGTPIIQKASMIKYIPVIYLYERPEIDVSTFRDAKPVYRLGTPSITQILVPFNKEYITDNHLEEKKERGGRISAFVETIKKNGKVSLSFEDNMKAVLESNKYEDDLLELFEELFQEARNE